jgi:hypothetical protein
LDENQPAYALVGAAAAKVAGHAGIDIRIAGVRMPGQKGRRRHNLSRMTVAALGHIVLYPGLLQRVRSIGGQAFDGGNIFPDDLGYRGYTGPGRFSSHMDGTGAAKSHAASELRPRQADIVSENPQQRRVEDDIDAIFLPVNL